MIVVAIIAVVLAIAVPSFTVIAKDLAVSQARSDVFAALTAARSRALRERRMVALHIFRDVGRPYQTSGTPSLRWPNDPNHVPAGKLVMRLEVPNVNVPVVDANVPPGNFNHLIPGSQIVEFVWPADHDVIMLPESLGVCRPETNLQGTVDINKEVGAPAALNFYEDFYIVFAEDGKLASVLVDYNLKPTDNNPNATAPLYEDAPGVQTQVVYPGSPTTYGQTWSAMGLCIYDMQEFKSLSAPAQYAYVNRSDNQVVLSAYTGLPLSMEVTK